MPGLQIAVDVMGGDEAPGALLRGAIAAGIGGDDAVAPERILLVGDRSALETFFADRGGNPGFDIRHASQVIGMGESPAAALRSKRDSSIGGCITAVAEGIAGGVVSMGNTGAVVAASTLGLGKLSGVHRPGIAVTLELTGDPVTFIDMGANIAPKPEHLRQNAEMASVYMRDCLGVAEPRVGLLNVGEEKGKGTDLLKEAYGLLEDDPNIRFHGNVEGGDLFRGVCDVVVTDGFTGNVILKLLEHFSGFMLGLVMAELQQHGAEEWGGAALANVKRAIDYSTYGGALLLGVKGIVIIGHGRSDESAVANAVRVACRAIDSDVNRHIEQGLGGSATR